MHKISNIKLDFSYYNLEYKPNTLIIYPSPTKELYKINSLDD